jgi:hypothetical protein
MPTSIALPARRPSLASKADLAATKTEIAELRTDLKTKITATKTDLLKWIIGAIGFQTVVILGAVVSLARSWRSEFRPRGGCHKTVKRSLMGWLTKGNLASSPAAVSRGRPVDPGIRRQAITEAVYTKSRTHPLATLSAIVRARVLPFGCDLGQLPGADIAGKNPWPLVRPPARPTPETVATASLRSPRSRRASPPWNTRAGQTSPSASKHHGRLPLNRSVGAPHLMSKTGEVGAVFRQWGYRRRFPPKPASVACPGWQ